MNELERRRSDFEEHLSDVRLALRRELGWKPRGWPWLACALGLAGGLIAGKAIASTLRDLTGVRRRRLPGA